MENEFDPYRKWLGIPPAEQPANLYRLLGLGIFEEDRDVISNAADRQMTHVRTFQGGKYAELSQKVLNELSAARVILLDPEKKKEYDDQLRKKFQSAAQVVQVVGQTPIPVAMPVTAETPATPTASILMDVSEKTETSLPAHMTLPPAPPPVVEELTGPTLVSSTPSNSSQGQGGTGYGRKKSPSKNDSMIYIFVIIGIVVLAAVVFFAGSQQRRTSDKVSKEELESYDESLDEKLPVSDDDIIEESDAKAETQTPPKKKTPTPAVPPESKKKRGSETDLPDGEEGTSDSDESPDLKVNFEREDFEKKELEKQDNAKKDAEKKPDKKPEEAEVQIEKPKMDEIQALGGGIDLRNSPKQDKMLSFFGADAETQTTITAALNWMAKRQWRDGSWNFNHSLTPAGRAPTKKSKYRNVGTAEHCPNAATALALLAMIGDGRSLKHKELGPAIQKGARYLAQKASYVTDRPLTNPRAQEQAKEREASLVEGDIPEFRSHAWGTLVMCELLSLTKDDKTYRVAANALTAHIIRQQNKDGGWPDRERGLSSNNTIAAEISQNKSSTSATIWNLIALKAAEEAGIGVPVSSYNKAAAYLKEKVLNVEERYPFPKPAKIYPTDITEFENAAFCLQLLDKPPKRVSLESVLAQAVQDATVFSNMQRSLVTSWLARDIQGPVWDAWNAILKQNRALQTEKGDDRGSWWYGDKENTLGTVGGRFYCTAMMALVMESYYRYAPMRSMDEKGTYSELPTDATPEKVPTPRRERPVATDAANPSTPAPRRRSGSRSRRTREVEEENVAPMFANGLESTLDEESNDTPVVDTAAPKTPAPESPEDLANGPFEDTFSGDAPANEDLDGDVGDASDPNAKVEKESSRSSRRRAKDDKAAEEDPIEGDPIEGDPIEEDPAEDAPAGDTDSEVPGEGNGPLDVPGEGNGPFDVPENGGAETSPFPG